MNFSSRRLSIFCTACAFFLLSACAQNLELLKKQAVSSRQLGQEYIKQGDYPAALRELLKAEKLYADDPILQNALGFAFMGRGKPELSIPHFKKALTLDTAYGEARNNLGVAFMKVGRWDAAIPCFETLVEDLLYKDPYLPLANLGWSYYNTGDLERSEKYYLEAIEHQPRFIKALRGLGLTYMAMGKGKKAVAALKKAIEIAPGFPQLNMDIARAYEMSGDRKNALVFYRKVITADPEGNLGLEARQAANRLQ